MCSAVGNKSATPYILKRDKRRRRKSVRTLYIHGRKKVVVDMPLTFMHQALLVAVTQTPIPVAGMTKRCRLLSHARKPAVRWKTLWDSSISDVACSSCSHFVFSLLKKQIAPFYEKIIHREIWFTDCRVERPDPFYHLNDVNVTGRQMGGQGGEAPNKRTHFLHAFFVLTNER